MKFFIGIVPPEEISSNIISFQKSFPNNDVVNVIEPHITIKRPEVVVDVDGWVGKIRSITEGIRTFQLSFEKVETFDNEVVFLKPNNSEELFSLHKQIFKISEASEEGSMYENDNYDPHLTLAGTKWKISKEELFDLKEKAQIVFENEMNFEVSFLRIYKKEDGVKNWEKFLDIKFGG